MNRKFPLLLLFAAALVLLQAAVCLAVLRSTSDGVLDLNAPDGWQVEAKEEDPDLVFFARRGGSTFTITKLNQDLGDYYLQTRLKNEIDALRSKGYMLSGVMQRFYMHSGSTLYYTAYAVGAKTVFLGFFTYRSGTYGVSSIDMPEQLFTETIYSARAKGQELPKRVAKQPKPAPRRPARRETPQETASEPELITSTYVPESLSPEPAATPAPEPVQEIAEIPRSEVLAEDKPPVTKPKPVPYVARRPLPFQLWLWLFPIWLAGRFAAAAWAKKLKYPKLGPQSGELPPDFFFPFIIRRFVTSRELACTITSRHGQRLMSYYDKTHELVLALSVYGVLLLHLRWSFAARYGGMKFLDYALGLPGGQFLAAFPEAIFIAGLFVGLGMYLNASRRVTLVDKADNLMLEAFPVAGGIVLLKDGKGKEVSSLKRLTPSFLGRRWQFFDADSQPVFEIRDDYPVLFHLRRLFGAAGGALRARYSIYAQNMRAGFVLNDPASSHGFQIHLEYSYARLAKPAQIVMAVLYIQSADRDYPYPWFV